MPTPQILGPNGPPLRRADLSKPVAAASLTGIRQAWNVDDIAGRITPDSLAATLAACDQGDAHAYLTLAEQMEEKYLHYRALLTTRKRAVCRLPVTVTAASDDPLHQQDAEEIRALTQLSGFSSLRFHMLDALGKGFSAVAINWDTSRAPWLPRNRLEPGGPHPRLRMERPPLVPLRPRNRPPTAPPGRSRPRQRHLAAPVPLRHPRARFKVRPPHPRRPGPNRGRRLHVRRL